MHELFVPRHASESVFRSSARPEELSCYKNAVQPCKFGHSLEVDFPNL